VANSRFLRGHIEDIPLPDHSVDVVISNCVINLSADKPRVLAKASRVLRRGGHLGISNVIADDGTDRGQLAESEQQVGCGTTLTQAQYRDLLLAAGFTGIAISSTHQAGAGLHSAIIQAAKPAARQTSGRRAARPPPWWRRTQSGRYALQPQRGQSARPADGGAASRPQR
jgi:SAM-dependent methyltransferase